MELPDFSMEKTNKHGRRINKSQQWQRSAKAKRNKYKGKSVKSMVKSNHRKEYIVDTKEKSVPYRGSFDKSMEISYHPQEFANDPMRKITPARGAYSPPAHARDPPQSTHHHH